MKQILLLEDDPALGEGIRMALRGGETAVTLVRTVKDARAALDRYRESCAEYGDPIS